MSQPRSKRGLSLAQRVLNAHPRYVAPEPHPPHEDTVAKQLRRREVLEQATFLTVEEVAFLLRASVDTVRRIPRDQLAARVGPGKSLIYLREDLMAFLKRSRTSRRRQSHGTNEPLKVAEDRANVVPFSIDAAIERIKGDGTA